MNEVTTHSKDTVVGDVRDTELQSPLSELVREYNDRIGIRDEYLWKWLHRSFPFVTLDCVPDVDIEDVCTHKTILSMYITLVDDLAENLNDEESFREATKIPFDSQRANIKKRGVRTEYLDFLQKVWKTVDSLIAETSRNEEFRGYFEFDLRQALNAMDYERLANERPMMMNSMEMLHYTSHNMVMLAAADIDLMNSEAMDHSDLGQIRKTVYQGQELVRISNWASTWERELKEGDITSSVFVTARARGTLSAADLEQIRDGDCALDRESVVSTLDEHGIEQEILEEWERKYANLCSDVSQTESVDLEKFVEGIKKVRTYHMKSKGHK